LSASRALTLALALALTTPASLALAAPSDDRILAVDRYTTEKARGLARAYWQDLRELNAGIYHCIPWVEVQRESIGFFRPKGVAQDDRYLSIRIYIEQDPSPAFARLAVEERASAMFSRYVGPLLRRMAASPALMADGSVDGFTVILEWRKQTARAASDRPIHETIAIFIPKTLATDHRVGRVSIRDVAARANVLGWDGESALGPLRLAGWEDTFVSTYKVKDYEVEPGVTCH
jgi:hypothetical protein